MQKRLILMVALSMTLLAGCSLFKGSKSTNSSTASVGYPVLPNSPPTAPS